MWFTKAKLCLNRSNQKYEHCSSVIWIFFYKFLLYMFRKLYGHLNSQLWLRFRNFGHKRFLNKAEITTFSALYCRYDVWIEIELPLLFQTADNYSGFCFTSYLPGFDFPISRFFLFPLILFIEINLFRHSLFFFF